MKLGALVAVPQEIFWYIGGYDPLMRNNCTVKATAPHKGFLNMSILGHTAVPGVAASAEAPVRWEGGY